MRLVVALPLAVFLCGPAAAADHARTIAPFLDEQTLAVAHVDLSRLDVEEFLRWSRKLEEDAPEKWAKEAWEKEQEKARRQVANLTKGGLKHFYVVFSLADIPNDPPLLVVPLETGADVKALTEALEKDELFGELAFEEVRGALVGGGRAALKRVKALEADRRPELAEAFEAAGDGFARLVFLPTPVLRRALAEALPVLPPEVGGGPTKVLADGALWLALGCDTPPRLWFRLVVKAPDALTARSLQRMALKGIEAAGRRKGVRAALPDFEKLAEMLAPKLDGNRLVLALKEKELTALLTPAVRGARDAAISSQATNNLKQIGLAMHNYHDTHGHLPPPAFTDKQGKPLLSWRVHLLPYLDENDLYKEFRLDEPWDSEHNKKLIEKLPKVLTAPAADPALAREGKTTYLLPVGRDAGFPGSKARRFADFPDGLSQTLFLAEADDARAVVWTKPDDLAYDSKEPAKGLRVYRGKGFLGLFGDGSVRSIPTKIDKAMLRAIFTPDGGEAISLP